MKLILTETDQQDFITEEEKTIIHDILEKIPEEDYEKKIEEEPTVTKIETLSSLAQNLVNWYPFRPNASLLEIGANLGEITGFLCNTLAKVVAIESSKTKAQAVGKRHMKKDNLEMIAGTISTIQLTESFDYILIHHMEKQQESLEKLIQFATDHLKEDGIILLAIPNYLGIYKLNCTNKDDPKELQEKRKWTKTQIESILAQKNNYFTRFYYPLPNEKIPNIIFTDQHLPSHESILRDLSLYQPTEFVKADERTIYRDLIEENPKLFPSLANAFLIEISSKPIQNKIQLISFGNSRKPEYRLKTIMLTDEVQKSATQKLAQNHIKTIQNNIDQLKQSSIHMLDSYEGNIILSRLIQTEKSFDKQLIQLAKEKGTEKLIEPIQKFKTELSEKLAKSKQTENTVFEKYQLVCPQKDKLQFIEQGIFDLIFQNCFVIENQFYFYDQEWIEENIPIEFILYRAIYYLGNSEKSIDVSLLYETLGLEKWLGVFEQLENILQDKIKDEAIWGIHAKEFKTVQNLYDTYIHYRNLEAKKQLALEEITQKRNQEKMKAEEELKQKDQQLQQLIGKITEMENSKSWKLTKPLRDFRKKLK